MHMGVGRIFSRGASRGFSQFFFQEGPKVVKFVFYPSNLKKKTLLLIISKSMGANAPPSDAHEYAYCVKKLRQNFGLET